MTRADGKGAVASWSPTGLGVSTGHEYLDRGFFQAVFQDGVRTLGEATTAGKLKLWATGGNLDLLDTYLLFGDPATNMLTPAVSVSIGLAGGNVELTWPAVPGATRYDVYRAANQPYFQPYFTLDAPYATGVTSSWQDTAGAVGNATINYTYVLRASGGSTPGVSKRVSEFDFDLVPGQ